MDSIHDPGKTLNAQSNYMVSVLMAAYNHEKFIQQALEGVLMQKTSFQFEIIIHDDFSQDNTANIIKSYADKYPNMIKPIIQTENMFSKGVKILSEYLIPFAQGKYIAFCECDDYWTDENKLENQVGILENNPDYSACSHNCTIVDEKNEEFHHAPYRLLYGPYKDYIHTIDYYWKYPGMMPGQTATIMFRRSVFDSLADEKRDAFFSIRANGDVKTCFLLLLSGYVDHTCEKMSCYRVVLNEGDSWTAKMKGQNNFGRTFVSDLDLLNYAKNYFGTKVRLHYRLCRSSIKAIFLNLRRPTAQNRNEYMLVRKEFSSTFHLLVFILKCSIFSIPTLFRRVFRCDQDLFIS